MLDLLKRAGGRAALIAGIAGLATIENTAAQGRGLLREVWRDVDGTRSIDILLQNSGFPDQPDSRFIIHDFDAPEDFSDYYGQRIRGFIVPPQSGDYIFWISSDNESVLFLSTDESPDNKEQIASVPDTRAVYPPRQWTVFPEQQSEPIRLERRRRYYVEVIMKDDHGGDHLTVRWQLPDGTVESPIPNVRLRRPGSLADHLADTDEDGLRNADEIFLFGTNPNLADTDGDGLSDGWEIGIGRYEVIDGSITWEVALTDAISRGGHLATIVSEAEWQAMSFVLGAKLRENHRWLGGTDAEQEDDWRWITGEPWDYTRWDGGEPNNYRGNEHALHLYGDSYGGTGNLWNDYESSSRRSGYILERGSYTNPTVADSDEDGLSDGREWELGTLPFVKDSDGDRFTDGQEVLEGTDPLDAQSVPAGEPDFKLIVDVSSEAETEDGSEAAPFRSIQAAIDAADSSELILVRPGTYREKVDFKWKSVWVKSSDGAESTVIEVTRGDAVNFQGGSEWATLEGFTVKSTVKSRTKGIRISNGAQPLIKNCFITEAVHGIYLNNPGLRPRIVDVTIFGATSGISIYGREETHPVIRNSRVLDCGTGLSFGARGSEATVVGCTFYRNETGVRNIAGGNVHLVSCTVVGNGVGLENSGEVWAVNSIFAGNGEQNVVLKESSRATVDYCLLDAGRDSIGGAGLLEFGENNVFGNPGFVNAEAPWEEDFTLREDSPALGAGSRETAAAFGSDAALPKGSDPDIGAVEHPAEAPRFAVAVHVQGGGRVQGPAADSGFARDEQVEFSALPDVGWEFLEWRFSGQTSLENPLTLAITESFSLEAVFRELSMLTLLVNGEGEVLMEPGLVSPVLPPPQITVVLTALPAEGSGFLGFSGDIVTLENPATFVLVGHKSVTANFAKFLKVAARAVQGEGEVIFSAEGEDLLPGDRATFEAVPAAGFGFSAWAPESLGRENPLTLTLETDIEVGAVFEPVVVLETRTSGKGRLIVEPAREWYFRGAVVEVSAIPDEGWEFGGWSDAPGGDNPRRLTLLEDTLLEALFVELGQLELTLIAHGKGRLESDGSTTKLLEGTRVNLRALPAPGFRVERWEGTDGATGDSAFVIMDADKTAAVWFVPRFQLTLLPPETSGGVFALSIAGDEELTLRLEASSALINWTPLLTVTNATKPVLFQDRNSRFLNRRFYRLVPDGQ